MSKNKINLDSLCVEITSDMISEMAKKSSNVGPKEKKKIMKDMLKDLISAQLSENGKTTS
jgi:hypothetical protein